MKASALKKLSKYGKYNLAALLRSAAGLYSDAEHSESAEDSPLWPRKMWPKVSRADKTNSTLKYIEARAIEQALILAAKQAIQMLNIDVNKFAKELGANVTMPDVIPPMAYLLTWDKRTVTMHKKDVHKMPLFLKDDKKRDIQIDPACDTPRFHTETLLYSIIKGHKHIEVTPRGKKFMKKHEIMESKEKTS